MQANLSNRRCGRINQSTAEQIPAGTASIPRKQPILTLRGKKSDLHFFSFYIIIVIIGFCHQKGYIHDLSHSDSGAAGLLGIVFCL